MGASSSTQLETDVEASIRKLFENNIHKEGSPPKSVSRNNNIQTSSLEQEYPVQQPIDQPEYLKVSSPEMPVNGSESDDYDSDTREYPADIDLPGMQIHNDYYKYSNYPSTMIHCNISNRTVNISAVNELEENDGRRDPVKDNLVLYKAALKGDWGKARAFLNDHPEAVTARITKCKETALHVAVRSGHSMFVEQLVRRMPRESLEYKESDDDYTALHLAAIAGITRVAKALVKANRDLTQIPDKKNWVPLAIAAYHASSDEHKEMVKYLCRVTRDESLDGRESPFSGVWGGNLLYLTTASSSYDIALYLVNQFPYLATQKNEAKSYALEVIADKSSAFLSGSQLTSLQRFIYSFIPVKDPLKSSNDALLSSCGGPISMFFSMTNLTQVLGIEQVYTEKLMHKQALALVKRICIEISSNHSEDIINIFSTSDILWSAVRNGTIELVREYIQICPDLVWLKLERKSILQQAIKHRRENVFALVSALIGDKKKWFYSTENYTSIPPSQEQDNTTPSSRKVETTILHIAAKLAPSYRLNSISGAALQMQWELKWYKEVENFALERHQNKKNEDGETSQEVFTDEHKDLLKKGEEWMKCTAESCTLVAALIATVAFAAAFTVPGGNISDSNNINNGIPILLNKTAFMVFAIANSLALFSSITSVIIFLSILTARYAEQDFLKSLPGKLIIGLAFLFFSIATMIIAFTATLSLVFGHRMAWLLFPIVLFACVPVALFLRLQLPLFVMMINSTYGPTIFDRQRQCMPCNWEY